MTSIAVVMASYNGAKYIAEQLASIAGQTLAPQMIVVVDDGSSDKTCEIVQNLATQLPIKLYRNETNLGATATFARALQLAPDCEWIAFADQDDVWEASKLAELVASAEQQKVDGVFSNALVVNAELNPLADSSQWRRVGFSGQADAATLFGQLVRYNVVTGATLMMRRSLALKYLPIPKGWIHDYWFALQLAARGKLGLCAKQLIKYRQHGDNLIGSAANTLSAKTQSARTKSRETYLIELERFFELKSSLGKDVGSAVASFVEAKVAHLRFRAGLHDLGVARSTREVLRRVLNGDYRRLDRGLYSALKDLVRL